jgi:hypothetical protein
MIAPVVAGRQVVGVAAALLTTIGLVMLPRDVAACSIPSRQDKAEGSWKPEGRADYGELWSLGWGPCGPVH